MSKNIVKGLFLTDQKIDNLIDGRFNFKFEENVIVHIDFSSTKQAVIATISSYRTALGGCSFAGVEDIKNKLCELEDALGEKVNYILILRKDEKSYHIQAECKKREDKAYIKELINSELLKLIISKADMTYLEGLTFKDLYLKEREENARLQNRKEKFRKSGHLVEQSLKYRYPKDNKPDLFSSLEDEDTKTKIINSGLNITTEGIQLTSGESRLVDALNVLLHNHSQNNNPKADDYYAGEEQEPILYAGEETIAPMIAFSLYELAKEFYSEKEGHVSGKQMENIASILVSLHNKKFCLMYTETSYMEDGSKRERKIEDFQPLVRILKLTETFTDKNGNITKTEKDTKVMLSPLFRRQLATKSISYPTDINRRMMLAYGDWNVPVAILKLRDYLLLEKSQKRKNSEINLDRLYYKIYEKYMNESRKKKVKEGTHRALETMINLGLLEKYDIVIGAGGQQKVIFTINLDWE